MSFKASLFQMKPTLGKIKENATKILQFYNSQNVDVVITPELALCGYSPMDNLYSDDFQDEINSAIKSIQENTKENTSGKKPALILGTPWFEDGKIYNVALVICNGEITDIVYKSKLPNYGVFNEHRYFSVKDTTNVTNQNVISIGNKKIALFVCEDMWHQDKVDSVAENVDLVISINASPFEISNEDNKNDARLKIAQYACKKLSAPLIYLNIVGGVDDVIFDGSSFVLNKAGEQLGCMNHAQEDSLTFDVEECKPNGELVDYSKYNKNSLIYDTIQLGLKDFLSSSGFNGVIIGISGGIDSTITASLAVDALGAENVLGISMPSKYTSKLSLDIIDDMRKKLGIKILEISIDGLVSAYEKNLPAELSLSENNVLDNIQARIRGQILMAYSNQHKGFMVLTTGNKSEIAVGYSTIYGDTCGGYNLLKDLYKTSVFEISRWRNSNIPTNSKLPQLNVIPELAISRKPSAELQDGQFDEDSLMDYNILDGILYNMIEKKAPLKELYKLHNSELVNKVVNLLKFSHYKRLQSATGVNVSIRPFGKDYQYNISDSFKINNTKS